MKRSIRFLPPVCTRDVIVVPVVVTFDCDGSTWTDNGRWPDSEPPVRDETESLAAQIAAAGVHLLRN